MTLESQIRRKGAALGFDRVRITTAAPLDDDHAARHQQYLDAGYAGKLGYLHRNNDKRFCPGRLLDGAQSVICVALNYRAHASELSPDATPAIARYALYQDYHDFVKARLVELAAFIQSLCPDRKVGFKACAGAIPLAEKALAQRAGIGFIGRNHLMIHPELGGQLVLGELLTTLALTPDAPLEGDFCAACGACAATCPTGALQSDGTLDARKCISYLTVEAAGDHDDITGRMLGHRVFGCDSCLSACPYEKNAPPRSNPDLIFHADWAALTPEDILSWTQEDFEKTFKGSCLERPGLTQLQRNAQRVLDNRNDVD